MLECSTQKVPQSDAWRLADVCCGPPHTYPIVPIEDVFEGPTTSVVEDCLENFPERFVCLRVDPQLRG